MSGSTPARAVSPGSVEAVLIATSRANAEDTMRERVDLGIQHVWLHRGPGAASVVSGGRRIRARTRPHGDRRRLPVRDPTADLGRKATRAMFSLTGKIPRQV